MARKFLTPIDMNKLELQNAAAQNLSSDPSSPVSGQFYFNTTDSRLKQYTGSAWVEYSTAASAGDASTNTATSVDGEVALFSGTTGKIIKRATGSGLVKVTSGVFGTATASTDYAPATTGSSILKGNGSGGFSAAASGTDYAPPTATTSSLKGNGSGGFSAATLNDNGAPTADFSMNSHKLTNVTDPTSPQDAATKNYVDVTVQGLQEKPTATVATTAALPAGTYSNGTAGVGATFTVTATGTTTVDSYTLAAGDLVLVKDQASAFQNGLYTVTTAGTTGVSTVLTRHADMDQAAEFKGAFIPVGNTGTANANSMWLANPSGVVTVGTTSIPFTQLNGATDLVASTGVTISGNTLSITSAYAGNGIGTVNGIAKGNGSGTISAAAVADIRTAGGTGKFTATIGDGSTTAISVSDNFATTDKIAQVRDASTNAVVECDITYASNTTTLTFAVAPASNAYKVVVIG